jgi:hypothetical protein
VEHDASWAQRVTDQLDREHIGRHVSVVHAPLVPHPFAAADLLWYDEAALATGLDTTLRGDLIDLLVVDVPPAYRAPSLCLTTSIARASRRSYGDGSARPGCRSNASPNRPASQLQRSPARTLPRDKAERATSPRGAQPDERSWPEPPRHPNLSDRSSSDGVTNNGRGAAVGGTRRLRR